MFGDSQALMPAGVKIFNEVGLVYGYLTGNAYIVDFEREVEFLLTASVRVNEHGIFNDEEYEYEEVGLPSLAALGRALYDYELNRAFMPDLSTLAPRR